MRGRPERLTVDLLSDTTFGRGEGTAGVVDVEVEHDAWGLPFLGGKALRGLLRDAWLSMQPHFPELCAAGRRVLGPLADLDETAILRIGDAVIEEPARSYLVAAVEREHHLDLPRFRGHPIVRGIKPRGGPQWGRVGHHIRSSFGSKRFASYGSLKRRSSRSLTIWAFHISRCATGSSRPIWIGDNAPMGSRRRSARRSGGSGARSASCAKSATS